MSLPLRGKGGILGRFLKFVERLLLIFIRELLLAVLVD